MVSSARSTCSMVWVAMRLKRIRVSCGATAGETTGFTNIPSSRRSRVIANVLKSSDEERDNRSGSVANLKAE